MKKKVGGRGWRKIFLFASGCVGSRKSVLLSVDFVEVKFRGFTGAAGQQQGQPPWVPGQQEMAGAELSAIALEKEEI